MSDKDGGAAFPRPIGNNGRPDYMDSEISYAQAGMSLRDWFAGQAIVSMCRDDADWDSALVARCAYVLADAMLAERAKAEGAK
jgi:hypothetical protein